MEKRIIVALDFDTAKQARELLACVDPTLCRVKIGKELFTACGPRLVKDVCALGFDVFLDLKFHDIPNTVAGAVRVAANMGVWMVNVHALGGMKMMTAAKAALQAYGKDAPLLIGVTVLTSMQSEELASIGVGGDALAQVGRLASLSAESGLDGVVCSAREVSVLRTLIPKDFLLVTPGIRPAGSELGDQQRVATPSDAIAMGSNYLVVGRPITRSADPLASLKEINASLGY